MGTHLDGRIGRRRWPMVAIGLAGAVALAGCSNKASTTTTGGTPSSGASASASAPGGSLSPAASAPATAAKGGTASCSTVSGAEVSTALGHSYADGSSYTAPVPSISPPAGVPPQVTIVACIYEDTQEVAAGMPPLVAPSRVIITYSSGASAAGIAYAKSQAALYKETVTDVPGVGDEAFLLTAGTHVGDITARKGGTEVHILASSLTTAATPAQLSALATQILSRL